MPKSNRVVTNRYTSLLIALFGLLAWPIASVASASSAAINQANLTNTWLGIGAIIVFVIAYCFVIAEEFLHMRKSKPVMLAAGLIWILVALAFASIGDTTTPAAAIRHNLLEYVELLLFLLAAMTYVNTMAERNIFEKLRAGLVNSGYSLRKIFWITGVLAFVISPVADNLTTALVMAAVVISVGAGNMAFISVACVNIVVAANAGGAFSPFGDITTLMVWQKGLVDFTQFFVLFIPSVVNWLVPAAIMSFAVPKMQPKMVSENVEVKPGGYVVVALFLLTILMAVLLHTFLHLPPVLGMMTGLGVLKIYGYFIRQKELAQYHIETSEGPEDARGEIIEKKAFDIFKSLKDAEWDTLMFFYGVILCVGGLGTLGYLAVLSEFFYIGYGATYANIAVGVLSALIDNIPVMFAVLSMNPDMSLGQWLLVTLTAGVGGSLLSIGSAAGVALMGQARGVYTFFSHMKWTWAIALGYGASIWVHLWINADLM